jgi:microcompartment protein CcmL/EutN
MKRTIGLLEFKSIAKGMETTDEILKSANVELILATALCPGKYITIITGELSAVKTAIAVGERIGDFFLIDAYVLSNVHESVMSALTATSEIGSVSALGVVETMSAVTAVMVGDTAAKASKVDLIEIRIARGLGGKGFALFSGEISAVKAAVQACLNEYKMTGEILYATTISSPSKALIDSLL